MKVVVIGIICIVCVQNACSAPKWTSLTPGRSVDDLGLKMDPDFMNTDMDFNNRTCLPSDNSGQLDPFENYNIGKAVWIYDKDNRHSTDDSVWISDNRPGLKIGSYGTLLDKDYGPPFDRHSSTVKPKICSFWMITAYHTVTIAGLACLKVLYNLRRLKHTMMTKRRRKRFTPRRKPTKAIVIYFPMETELRTNTNLGIEPASQEIIVPLSSHSGPVSPLVNHILTESDAFSPLVSSSPTLEHDSERGDIQLESVGDDFKEPRGTDTALMMTNISSGDCSNDHRKVFETPTHDHVLSPLMELKDTKHLHNSEQVENNKSDDLEFTDTLGDHPEAFQSSGSLLTAHEFDHPSPLMEPKNTVEILQDEDQQPGQLESTNTPQEVFPTTQSDPAIDPEFRKFIESLDWETVTQTTTTVVGNETDPNGCSINIPLQKDHGKLTGMESNLNNQFEPDSMDEIRQPEPRKTDLNESGHNSSDDGAPVTNSFLAIPEKISKVAMDPPVEKPDMTEDLKITEKPLVASMETSLPEKIAVPEMGEKPRVKWDFPSVKKRDRVDDPPKWKSDTRKFVEKYRDWTPIWTGANVVTKQKPLDDKPNWKSETVEFVAKYKDWKPNWTGHNVKEGNDVQGRPKNQVSFSEDVSVRRFFFRIRCPFVTKSKAVKITMNWNNIPLSGRGLTRPSSTKAYSSSLLI